MTDTHAHIYSDKFSADIGQVLENCFNNGLKKIYMPNVDASTIEGMMALEKQYPGQCHAMMGLHPCSVDQNLEQALATMESWLSKRAFCAIGETGLDKYWDTTFFEQQLYSFEVHADWAKKYQLPLVVHTRSCMQETIEALTRFQDGTLRGVVHCFSGNLAEARAVVELGFMLGIGGVATYKNGGLDQVLPHIPLSAILLETDSPYLAPVPFRGKRNQPGYLSYIAQAVAQHTGRSVEEIEQVTDQNAERFFMPGSKTA
jgi:TatD DNase family protein